MNTSNFLLIYAKNKTDWTPNRIFTARGRDKRYNQFLINADDDYENWKTTTLTAAFAESLGLSEKEARAVAKTNPDQLESFVIDYAPNVIRLARPDYKGGERILFYRDKLKMIDGVYVAGEPLTTIWDDILSNNLHNEGGESG